MSRERMTWLPGALLALGLAGATSALAAGDDVYWHIDPGVKTCSMVIDPALTQGQWHTFARQAGAIVDYKSVASAQPLGRGHYSVGITYASTPVDQHPPAWITTFTHPDAGCPLGDQIKMPTLRATLGVSRAVDVTGFWTTAPGANYGLVGGAVQYAFLRESARVPAAAVSASFSSLTGVPDFDFNIASVGLSASKRFARVTPYLGVRQGVAIANETTSKVSLARENVSLTHAFAGATASLWKLGVALEYDVASVNTLALRLGVQP